MLSICCQYIYPSMAPGHFWPFRTPQHSPEGGVWYSFLSFHSFSITPSFFYFSILRLFKYFRGIYRVIHVFHIYKFMIWITCDSHVPRPSSLDSPLPIFQSYDWKIEKEGVLDHKCPGAILGYMYWQQIDNIHYSGQLCDYTRVFDTSVIT